MEIRSLARDMLYSVQYLRALAALAVFYFHLSVTTTAQSSSQGLPFDQIGAVGVDLFFVISGFIMAMIVWEKPIDTAGFMKARLFRIAPLYWLLTFAVFFIALIWPSLLGSTTADPLQLFHSLLFIPYGLGQTSALPTLLVGWTLNYEMFFYVLVALGAGLFKDRTLVSVCGVIALMSLLGIVFEPQNRYAQFYLDSIIMEFPLGILVFHCWRMIPDGRYSLLMILLLALAIITLALTATLNPGHFRFIIWGVPSALILLCSLKLIGHQSRFLKDLGDWSYSIYLLHLFVIMGFIKLMPQAVSPQAIGWPLYVIIVSGVLIIASAITHQWVEKPMTVWLKQRFWESPPKSGDARRRLDDETARQPAYTDPV